MAIEVLQDKCIGCGACEGACPFGAISVIDGLACISEACTLCGACADACPVEALKLPETEPRGEDDLSAYTNVWVYLETHEHRLAGVSAELLGQGRRLADKLGQKLVGVVIDSAPDDAAKDAAAYGADEVLVVRGEVFDRYTTDAFTAALVRLIKKYRPSVLLLGATLNGRDLGPRAACRLGTGLTADCTALDIEEQSGLVVWTRPAFGGNIMADILCPDRRPQIGTVRPNVFKKPQKCGGAGCVFKEEETDFKAEDDRVKITEIVKTLTACVNLEEAQVIVSGGRGMKEAKNFAMLEELAGELGAAVGASRAAVDSGWIDQSHQVGQTGKTVAPKIYIACGISGAIQHLAGMSGSDIIIAVNKDPHAPIFDAANYCVVGDLFEVVPALTKAVRAEKAARQA